MDVADLQAYVLTLLSKFTVQSIKNFAQNFGDGEVQGATKFVC